MQPGQSPSSSIAPSRTFRDQSVYRAFGCLANAIPCCVRGPSLHTLPFRGKLFHTYLPALLAFGAFLMRAFAKGLLPLALVLLVSSLADAQPNKGGPLSPEDALKALKVADGFQVELFAAEPMLINPTSIDVDHK